LSPAGSLLVNPRAISGSSPHLDGGSLPAIGAYQILSEFPGSWGPIHQPRPFLINLYVLPMGIDYPLGEKHVLTVHFK
jgi:hypothetical protein